MDETDRCHRCAATLTGAHAGAGRVPQPHQVSPNGCNPDAPALRLPKKSVREEMPGGSDSLSSPARRTTTLKSNPTRVTIRMLDQFKGCLLGAAIGDAL